MYEEGFRWWNLGFASAVAFVLFAIMLVVSRASQLDARSPRGSGGRGDECRAVARRPSLHGAARSRRSPRRRALPAPLDGLGLVHAGRARRARSRRRSCRARRRSSTTARSSRGSASARYFAQQPVPRERRRPCSRSRFNVDRRLRLREAALRGPRPHLPRAARRARHPRPGDDAAALPDAEGDRPRQHATPACSCRCWRASSASSSCASTRSRSPTSCSTRRASTARASCRIFLLIVLPVLTPILVTLALFTFLGTWNDFMWPLIVLTDEDHYTLPVALATSSREHVQDNELMMAGSVLTILPVLLALPRRCSATTCRACWPAASRDEAAASLAPRWPLLAAARSRPGAGPAARLLDDFATPTAWRAHGVGRRHRHDAAGRGRRSGSITISAAARATPSCAAPCRSSCRPISNCASGCAARARPMRSRSSSSTPAARMSGGTAAPIIVPPGEWQTIRIRRRQIEFAWGPTADRTLRRSGGDRVRRRGGHRRRRAAIAVDDLQIGLPPLARRRPPRAPTRSSARPGHGAARAWTATRRPPGSPREPRRRRVLHARPRLSREFGGLVLRWVRGAAAPATTTSTLSDDGARWRDRAARCARRRRAATGCAARSEARYVRIRVAQRRGDGRSALAEVEVRPPRRDRQRVRRRARGGGAARPLSARLRRRAEVLDPGRRRRRPQSGLIDEDGAIEVGRRRLLDRAVRRSSAAPCVTLGRRRSIAHVAARRRPADPDACAGGRRRELEHRRVRRRRRRRAQALARYRLRNHGAARAHVDACARAAAVPGEPAVAIPQHHRRRQPDPASCAWDGRALAVNGVPRLRPLTRPARSRARAARGRAGRRLVRARGAARAGAHRRADALATAPASRPPHWRTSCALRPGEQREVAARAAARAGVPAPPERGRARQQRGTARAHVARRAGRVRISGRRRAAAGVRHAAHRARPHPRHARRGRRCGPGSRSYARAWIRDGAMMSTALLRLGLDDVGARLPRMLRAVSSIPDGKVPCCVDARGADPVPEHDSHGELIFLVAELYRYTPIARGCGGCGRACAPPSTISRRCGRASASRRTATPRARRSTACCRRRSATKATRPSRLYSYWDDFWALHRLRDAPSGSRGARADRRRARARARSATSSAPTCSPRSRRRASVHGIDFIPGAADLGDFDATSTTIALAPGGLQHQLPAARCAPPSSATGANSSSAATAGGRWDAYTPYELRNVGAFVRLGWRERALALCSITSWPIAAPPPGTSGPRSSAATPREPRFIGDMPHGWVASD